MKAICFRSRESVIQAILRRERGGLTLNCEAVKAESKALYCGAFRHFRSWRNALRAAGVNVGKVERRRHWNREKTIAYLRRICARRQSLRQGVIKRRDSGFYSAARMYFGSWCNALVAAGINPESICHSPRWDRNRIVEAVLLRAVRGEALGSTTVRPRSLKSAAVMEFGSWSEALIAAGLEPANYLYQRAPTKKPRKTADWSKEQVLSAILQRYALGLPLYGNAILRDDRPLFLAGRSCFKSWSNALESAGFDPAKVNGNRHGTQHVSSTRRPPERGRLGRESLKV